MFHSFADNRKIHLDNIEQLFYYTNNRYHRTERRDTMDKEIQELKEMWERLSPENRLLVLQRMKALEQETEPDSASQD